MFFDDADRRTFLGLLVEASDRTDTEIHGYCLVGNHWHLVLRSGGSISETMQLAMSRYVRRFNRRHGFDGPLFRSRFTSKVIESDAQFAAVTRYVHRNAFDAGATSLAAYPWSSYRYFVAQRRPPWLVTAWTLGLFGGDRRRYQRFVETPSAGRTRPLQLVVNDVLAAEASPYALHDIDDVIAAVAAQTGVSTADIASSQPGVRNPARLAVFLLASESGIAPPSMGTVLGCSSDASTQRLVRRARERLQQDPSFAELVDAARRLLTVHSDAA